MTVLKEANGHEVAVGMELSGRGTRIQIDGTDVTDDVLPLLGPQPTDGHGLPKARGEDWTAATVAGYIRDGTITIEPAEE